MKSVQEIENNLKELLRILNKQIPIKFVDKHPFDIFSDSLHKINNSILEEIFMHEQNEEALIKKVELLKKEQDTLRDILNQSESIKHDVVVDNYHIEINRLENINIQLKSDIDSTRNAIEKIKEEVKEYLELLNSDDIDLNKKHDDFEGEENENNLAEDKININEQLKSIRTHNVTFLNILRDYEENRNLVSIYNLMNDLKISLKQEIEEKEKLREYFYKEIVNMGKLLKIKIQFDYNEDIFKLQKMVKSYKDKLETNKQKYREIMKSIEQRKKIFSGVDDIDTTEFELIYSDKYLEMMYDYENKLRIKQKENIQKIFLNSVENLLKLYKIFHIELDGDKNVNIEGEGENIKNLFPEKLLKISKVEFNSIFGKSLIEVVEKINEIIMDLDEKREIFIEIENIVIGRKELIKLMEEFEVKAKDPKRLFRSSFQLNKEEKFRKTAYPNLLAMEKNILDYCERYRKNFGLDFFYEGVIYMDFLKKEISNRVISKNIFINKFFSSNDNKKGK